MSSNKIIRTTSNQGEKTRLLAELRQARRVYLRDEALLAEEQAAVNAFRMHCRLKLDVLVDKLQALNAEKQSKLTELVFLRQGVDIDWLDEEDEFFQDEQIEEWVDDDPPLVLPTPTPKDKEAEKRLYRELARRFHPDLAKTAVEQSYRTMMMAAVNEAYAADNIEALYDLAGEFEPGEIIELIAIEDDEIRRLRQEILKMHQLSRKARRSLKLLREENTARLWQRAQLMDEDGKDWWSQIKIELENAVNKKQAEIDLLQKELNHLQQEQVMS